MRTHLTLLAAAAALVAGPAVAGKGLDREAELARAIGDRVAGPAVDCIDLHRVRGSHIIPGTAIVYDAGGVIYVNRPRNGAESMRPWDIMINRLQTSRLCSIDTVELVDQGSNMMTGIVFLGEFVPYRRVQSSDAR